MNSRLLSLFLSLSLLVNLSQAQSFFISGYGEGIYFSKLNDDGSMAEPTLLAKQANASFFCFHPVKKDIIYAVTETMRGDANNPASVVAYRYDRTAALAGQTPKLERLNSQKVDGDIPCHVTMDPSGKYLIIANYTNGSVVVFEANADGKIGKQTSNNVHQLVDGKKSSNGHCSAVSPNGRWVLVADLGLDRVFVYELSKDGKLQAGNNPFFKLADGAGPRHLSFHPNGKFVYIINETNLTMTAAAWDEASGKLSEINTVSTLPDGIDKKGFSTAEVLVHSTGKYVFGSNRGHDTIVTMSVDPTSGAIKRIATTATLGKTPRNFRLTPDGKMLLAENQSSDTIFSFKIDLTTGALTPTGKSTTVKAPACIKFVNEL
ncbi:MAG: lactonase family protein [Pirellulales bacterium]